MSPRSAQPLLPDLLAENLRVVFCGTAPSRASAAAHAYYAKPGNRFWPALHEAGFTPRRFTPAEYPDLLPLGIGLTDLCKHHAGVDASLPSDAFDVPALRERIRRHAPRWVAFTSKHAAALALGHSAPYGPQAERLAGSRVYVLCSPSGLATRFWDSHWWNDLGQRVGNGE